MPFDANTPAPRFRDIDAERKAAFARIDAEFASVMPAGKWVPAAWDLSDSIRLANEHRLRGEDAQ
jgi:hypothetical protein